MGSISDSLIYPIRIALVCINNSDYEILAGSSPDTAVEAVVRTKYIVLTPIRFRCSRVVGPVKDFVGDLDSYWFELRIVTMMYVRTYSKSNDQPGKVANPAPGQLNRGNEYFTCSRSRLRTWSRETVSAVPSPVSLLISLLRLNLVPTYGIYPVFCSGVHYLF